MPFRSGLHGAGHSHCAVMLEHVTVERIERGVIHVGRGHAFAKVVEHHDATRATEPAERFLVQFGPDARARTNTSSRTDLRLWPSVIMNRRVRRFSIF